jgi:hypothetical protein
LCGGEMLLRAGKWGPYWSCKAYPQCKGMAKADKALKARFGAKKSTPSRFDGDGVRPPAFDLLPQQVQINYHMVSSRNSLQIVAYAGCGKSSTVKMGLWAYKRANPNASILAACHGKRITEEFSHGCPKGVEISTWHSFGYAQLRAWAKSVGIQLEQPNWKKTDRIMDGYGTLAIIPGRDLDDDQKAQNAAAYHFRRQVRECVRLCKMSLLDGGRSDLEYLFERFTSIDTSAGADGVCLELVPQIIKQCLDVRRWGFDMDDMVWLPPTLSMPVKEYDLVIVDEDQDLNTVLHYLSIMACKSTGKMVVVGDPWQSIMGFTGSDTESMENHARLIRDSVGRVDTLPLTVSLRCTQIGGALARKIVPDFQVLPTAIPGEIKVVSAEELFAVPDVLTPGTMVTCRMNAPLLKMAWALLKQHIPCKVAGADFGEGLKFLIIKSRCTTTAQFVVWLDRWAESELNRLAKLKNGGGAQAELVEDKLDCLKHLCSEFSLMSEVESTIGKLFADIDPEDGAKRDFIVLSSVHKAKGLEADTVVCWPAHGPSPRAVKEWEIKQEYNLLYVQWTRFKKRMFVVKDPKDKKGCGVPSMVMEVCRSSSPASRGGSLSSS